MPLSTIGLLQYLTPTLQLLCGVLLLGERMSRPGWAGFGLVWVALIVLHRRHACGAPPGAAWPSAGTPNPSAAA